tara:strand:+ start:3529 stop:3876 length:348 start_codon:yes stop_codon:yes gene_type:complete
MKTNKITFQKFFASCKAFSFLLKNFFSNYLFKYESDIVKPERSIDHHFAFDFVYKYLLNQIRMNGQLSDEYLKKLKEMSSDDLQSLFLQIIDIENEVTKLEKEETQMKRNNVSTF